MLSIVYVKTSAKLPITNHYELMLQSSINPIVEPSWKSKTVGGAHKTFSVHVEVKIAEQS